MCSACKDELKCLGLGVCAHMFNNTHILDFLDKRIFPFEDHKKQLSPFFSGWPLVNVVNHTRLGTKERKCHLAGAMGRSVQGVSSALGSSHCLLERDSPDSHTRHPESGTRAQASPGCPQFSGETDIGSGMHVGVLGCHRVNHISSTVSLTIKSHKKPKFQHT